MAFGRVPRLTRLLYRLLYRNSDRVICQSRDMAKDLAEAAGIDEEQITVLPNPVDLAGIRAELCVRGGESGGGLQLLAVGRLSWEKGFDLLLKALAIVREQIPNVKLILVGAGREEAALKSLCRQLGLEDAVGFAGRIDPPYAFFARTATPASGGVADLLRGRPGAWLASEITAESLAAAIVAALQTIQPGDRVSHTFFATPVGTVGKAAVEKEQEDDERWGSSSAQE
jgi:glycosyltransferase involved in cell wall biosynthesis